MAVLDGDLNCYLLICGSRAGWGPSSWFCDWFLW